MKIEDVVARATAWRLTCRNCGGTWFKQSEAAPQQCPRCGSRRWNDDRLEPDTTKNRTQREDTREQA